MAAETELQPDGAQAAEQKGVETFSDLLQAELQAA